MKKITKILITGATGGLGSLLSRVLANKQTYLVLHARNRPILKMLGDELARECYSLNCIICDFSNEIVQLSFPETDFDVIINCAADFGPTENIVDLDSNILESVYKTNVVAPFILTQRSLKHMVNQNYGRIINIGSTAGLSGYSLRTPYCLSKHALIGLTHTTNSEITSGEYGKVTDVKAFCVCPGPFTGSRLTKIIQARSDYTNIPFGILKEKIKNKIGIIESTIIVDKIVDLINPGDKYKGQDVITFAK